MLYVVAALIRRGDKILACQRPAGKARELLWEFVGGKVEPGEAGEQALIRECQEELGVTIAVTGECMTQVHAYPDLTVHLTLYDATIPSGEPQALEHNDIRWVSFQELDQLPFCPADREIIEKLKAM